MRSFLHFYWGGSCPNYNLKSNLRNWAAHLAKSKSSFKIILWVDYVAFGKLKDNYSQAIQILQDEYQDYKWFIEGYSIGIKIFRERNFLQHYHATNEAYKLFVTFNTYPFASDIARIAILQNYGGIYLDCDMLPNFNNQFPNNITIFERLLQGCSSIGFYIIALPTKLENRFLISTRIGALTPGMQYIESRLQDVMKALMTNVPAMRSFFNSPENRHINSSFFMNEFKAQLEAFKNKDVGGYRYATSRSFQNYQGSVATEYTATPKRNYSIFAQSGIPIWTGTLNTIFDATFHIFHQYCSKNTEDYTALFQQTVSPFLISEQTAIDLGSWSDPGYSRLLKLKFAARVVEKYRQNPIKKARAIPKKQIKPAPSMPVTPSEPVTPTAPNQPRVNVSNSIPDIDISLLLTFSIEDAVQSYLNWLDGRNSIGFFHHHGKGGKLRAEELKAKVQQAATFHEKSFHIRQCFSGQMKKNAAGESIKGKINCNAHSLVSFVLNDMQKYPMLFKMLDIGAAGCDLTLEDNAIKQIRQQGLDALKRFGTAY